MCTRRRLAALSVALIAAMVALLDQPGAALAATIATLQAEAMKSDHFYGASVVTDASASGGRALRVDSAVTVKAAVRLPAGASRLAVRARTDGTAAQMVVSVDGSSFGSTGVSSRSWADYSYGRALAAGAHMVAVRFVNPDARNLYLDAVTFTGTTPTPPSEGQTAIAAYLTGYSWYDNDPPGSAAIAYPKLHATAGGTGTYADPITLAVGFTRSGSTVIPDWPPGTRFYVPALRRYFIVEDLCGACHGGARPPGTSTWLDMWVDGRTSTKGQADACMNAVTGAHLVIKDPVSTYAVASGPISANGACATLYGETPVVT